jgi:hypothetical protein
MRTFNKISNHGQTGSSDPNKKTFFQCKLTINQPNDIYEQEADAVADKVMRMTDKDIVQTKFFKPPVSAIQRKCTHCEEEEKKMQRKEMNEEETKEDKGVEHYVDNLNNQGQPLPNETRNFYEPRFGYDFSGVKVHTDTVAAKSAQSINALAYTSGNHIVFNSGQYSPGTDSGKRLLGHELTHVVQQGSAISRKEVQRQTGSGTPAPTYAGSCSGGATDPCQYSRCEGKHQGIFNDLLRASDYAIRAAGALIQSPLSQDTIRALDWYFNDHSPATAEIVAQRLRCIALCLIDTFGNDQYGCHPDYSSIAYVCVGSTPMCEQVTTNICLTDTYFGKSDRVRAEVLIHECGHRIGLSLGTDEDIYDHEASFIRLGTQQALMNSDSFALFAGAIVNGVRTSIYSGIFPTMVGVGGGVALSGGDPTWYARINYFNMEFQHPVLRVFNPNLGVSATLIGQSTSPTRPDATASTSLLASVTAGFRIADPRPGPAGGAYFSLWGGPSLAVSLGTSNSPVGLGAEAGFAGGYRWRWLDASVGGTYFHDPTRPEGFRDIFTIGPSLTITFLPIMRN